MSIPFQPSAILDRLLALGPGASIRISFRSRMERTIFKKRLASLRATLKWKSYRTTPDDPSYGVTPYTSITTQDISDTDLLIFNAPTNEEMGILKITEHKRERENENESTARVDCPAGAPVEADPTPADPTDNRPPLFSLPDSAIDPLD